tara:strand:- start:20 stop:139 length:120 start_codon:yes stop_codon:yes gene_type:complete
MNKIINTKWSFKDWISASVQPFLILGSINLGETDGLVKR